MFERLEARAGIYDFRLDNCNHKGYKRAQEAAKVGKAVGLITLRYPWHLPPSASSVLELREAGEENYFLSCDSGGPEVASVQVKPWSP